MNQRFTKNIITKIMNQVNIKNIATIIIIFVIILLFIGFIGNYTEYFVHISHFTEPSNTPPVTPPITPDISGINVKYDTTGINDIQNIENPTQLLTQYDVGFNNTHYYDTNNYNLQYHDPIDIILQNDNYGTGNISDISMQSIYYPSGNFPFGPSNYVPSYQDTVLLRYYSGQ